MEMEKGAITRFTLKPEWHPDAVVPEEGNKEAKLCLQLLQLGVLRV